MTVVTERLYLTPPVLAKELGVNVDRLRHWIQTGELKATNVGDKQRPRWRIHQDDWQAFLNARSNSSASAAQPARRRRRLNNVTEFF